MGCLSGARSAGAAVTLSRAGCKNVYNLRGGITAWRAAGFSVSKK